MHAAPANALDLMVSIVLYRPDIAKLQECLESVYLCKLNWRLHLIDNSDTPLEESFLKSLDKRVSYVHGQGNVGFGSGHNLAIHKHVKKARYWLVLNPDAYFGEGLLEKLVQRMDVDQAIGLCIPHIQNPDGSTQYVNKRLPTPEVFVARKLDWMLRIPGLKTFLNNRLDKFVLKDMDLNKPLICPFISGCFMFFRGSMLAELGGYDERYFLYMEDLDISRRAARRGLNVVFSDIQCFHHWERGAYKNSKLFRILVKSCISYFWKWGWVLDFERYGMNRRVRYYEGPTEGRRLTV
ncbi:MAG: glycosyltransferase [Alphaproteobacteria bacterium]|nr:MAG: glycosyltransferase [Alphaproteobacteria bacterium]